MYETAVKPVRPHLCIHHFQDCWYLDIFSPNDLASLCHRPNLLRLTLMTVPLVITPKLDLYTSGSQPFRHQGLVFRRTSFPQIRIEGGGETGGRVQAVTPAGGGERLGTPALHQVIVGIRCLSFQNVLHGPSCNISPLA